MTTHIEGFFYRALTTNAALERMSDEYGFPLLSSASTRHAPGSKSPLSDFSLGDQTQAKRMGAVYELLYCLENSVRELVEGTLREEFGPEEWWAKGVPAGISAPAEKRKREEAKARWHGPRGDSLINYVDFPQYAAIITSQWDLFEGLIGDQGWLINYFAEMNRSRRALAHTGTLTVTDVERMEFRVREWLRVVG